MKGSIRFFVGLVMTMGVVGGIDNATDAQLIPLVIMAGVSLGIMYSGVRAIKTV